MSKRPVTGAGPLVKRLCPSTDEDLGATTHEFGAGNTFYRIEELSKGPERRLIIYEVGPAAVKRPVGKIIYTVRPGAIIGGAGASAHIDSVWVAESTRGIGLGRILMHQVWPIK